MDTLYTDELNKTIDSVLTVVNVISKNTEPITTNECCDIWKIIILIILTGFLGGLVNYLSIKDSKERNRRIFFYNILLGIIGADLIPLFLNLTSSKLLDNCEQCYTTYLVLGGYMLLASIFSKRLLDNLGKKIFNLEDVKDEIDKAQTEPEVTNDLPESEVEDISEGISNSDSGTQLTKDQAIEETNKILANMQGSRYKFRTMSGIGKSTQLDNNKVFVILKTLISKNVVEEVNKGNSNYYKLTDLGQSLKLFKDK